LSEAVVAVSLIFIWVLVTLVVGVLAGIKRKFSLEGYLVSGRALGLVFMYVLMAGEVYSAYAFLGTGGWAYSYGAPIMYIGYAALAYSFGYFYAKYVWKAGKKLGYMTQGDLFRDRYGSVPLAVYMALVGIVFMIPYIQLQLQGLGYILHVTSFGKISVRLGIIVGMTVMMIYVATSGLRGIAWTNLLQAILMFLVAWAILFRVPFIKFGGVSEMFQALKQVSPQHLTLPGAKGTMGVPWFLSTMILCGLGFFMWPHLWLSILGAKDIRALRRTYVLLPIYTVFIIPVVLAGLTVAALGIQLSKPDEAVLKAVEVSFPTWVLGIVGMGGFAAATSTASGILLTVSALLSKNIYNYIKPGASDRELVLATRIAVIVVAIVAMLLAIFAGGRLVALLLLGYSGITQFFPGAVLGFFWDRVNKWAVGAGMTGGLITITLLKLFYSHLGLSSSNLLGIHFGLWGLIVNLIIVIAVSLASKPDPNAVKLIEAIRS